MKKILFYLSLSGLIAFSCDRSDETPTPTPTPTPVKPTPTPPQKDVATLSVIASGRDSYEDIEAWIGTEESNSFKVEIQQTLSKDGKAEVDVSNFIGKTLTIHGADKTTKKLITDKGTKITIAKNSNSISLNIPTKPVQKVYNANITVNKNGVAYKNAKVYAVRTELMSMFPIDISGSSVLQNQKSATTNEQGIATFENLPASIQNKYTFIVFTAEPDIPTLTSVKYWRIDLPLDGINTAKGTIDIKSTTLKISFNSSKSLEDRTIVLSKVGSEEIVHMNKIKNNKIEVPDIQKGEYTIKLISSECISFSPNTISVKENTDNNANIQANISTEGTLALRNASSNPYSVTVTHANGAKENFIMKGGERKNINSSIGTAKIYVKQNSGYVVYPTEETKNSTIKCNTTSSVCFPSDRCN